LPAIQIPKAPGKARDDGAISSDAKQSQEKWVMPGPSSIESEALS
jgi:hypothetical protein